MTSEVVGYDTPVGPGRFYLDLAGRSDALLILGHGAGGGVESADLALLADRLPAAGISVARFEQPWRTAGRKVAVAPPRLDQAWIPAVEWLVAQLGAGLTVVTGGRSAGARVACRTATRLGVDGVICLAFPLHPPGRPEKSRLGELLAPSVPRLVFQGARDSFGAAADVRAAVGVQPRVEVIELRGADHGYHLSRASGLTAEQLGETLVTGVQRFVTSVAGCLNHRVEGL